MPRMIEPGGMLQFMFFCAFPVWCAGVDEQVAVALDFVAGGPPVDVIPIPTSGDEVNVDDPRGERAFPSALPVRNRYASSEQRSYENE